MSIQTLASARYQARCKSGYVMSSTGHTCNRMASRGQLLCNDCATAVVIPSQPTHGYTLRHAAGVVVGVAMAAYALLGMIRS